MSLKKTSENMMKISIKIGVYTLLIIGLVLLANKGYRFGEDVFSDKGYENTPGTDIAITVGSGDGKMEVAAMLEKNGVIADKYVFYVQTLLYEGKFIAGDYALNSSQSAEDIIETLSTKSEQ